MIGRWQPLHNGHIALITSVLNEGNKVIVGVRDTELSDKNPYSVIERSSMIETAFKDKVRDGRLEIITVPDIDEIVYGRSVGYGVRALDMPKDIESISGTKTRENRQIVWLTGNTTAGKTTLANGLKKYYPHMIILDGDEMRGSISQEFGLSLKDRYDHNMRVARLAKTLSLQTKVVVAVIAPTTKIREAIESELGSKPIWCWIRNDKAPGTEERPYEIPENAAITINNTDQSIESSVLELHSKLTQL